MPINEDRPTELYIPMGNITPDGFRFFAGKMLAALSGFTDVVFFCMDGKRPDKCPVYITDGTREAVIMPLTLD